MKKGVHLFLAVMLIALTAVACAAGGSANSVDAATENSAGFVDVPADADYAEAVAYCRERGLMNGVSADRFDPNGTLTRAMAATILYRAEGEPAVTGSPTFTDTQAGTWYSNAIAWANDQGIVRGYGNGLFGTNNPVSVEQLEVMVGRYTNNGVEWVGDPTKAIAATRAQAAVAFFTTLKAMQDTTPGEGGKVLVAYFSATNNTEGVAEKIVTTLGSDKADLFEIVPATPYTSADLNWHDSSSRTTKEMNDSNARPAIADTCKVENMADYDVIFLGYPIWWGQAPRIISTFLESYDFSGKTVVPFCTSGSSGIGSSDTNLHALAAEADWLAGHRFSAGASQSTVQNWVDGLNLEQQ